MTGASIGGWFSECLGKEDCLRFGRLADDLAHWVEIPGAHHLLCVFPAACTDKELRNLASRLKDWFGALHEDANRVIKPTSSDTAQGSKITVLIISLYILVLVIGCHGVSSIFWLNKWIYNMSQF